MNYNNNEIKNQSGVYVIKNLKNEKIYIGSSVNVRKRMNAHVNALKNNCHENKYLQNSYNRHGSKHFVFNVIEYVESDSVRKREQYYIDKFKSYKRNIGYNINRNATGGGLYGEENGWYGKGYLQKGSLNHFYGKTHTKESRKLISKSGKLRIGKKNANYGNKYGNNPISKGVIQIDIKTRNKIKKYDSITRAYHDLGYHIVSGGISASCNSFREGYFLQTLGYYWCYAEDYHNIKNVETRKNKKEKEVVQLDKETGKKINTFPSIIEASRKLNISREGIARVCSGRYETSGGYKWMYLKDYNKVAQ